MQRLTAVDPKADALWHFRCVTLLAHNLLFEFAMGRFRWRSKQEKLAALSLRPATSRVRQSVR
jgi:hypothetical protein